jgi:hypothetical protein
MMSRSDYLRAAFAAGAMWIALLGAMAPSGTRPSTVDRSGPAQVAGANG